MVMYDSLSKGCLSACGCEDNHRPNIKLHISVAKEKNDDNNLLCKTCRAGLYYS